MNEAQWDEPAKPLTVTCFRQIVGFATFAAKYNIHLPVVLSKTILGEFDKLICCFGHYAFKTKKVASNKPLKQRSAHLRPHDPKSKALERPRSKAKPFFSNERQHNRSQAKPTTVVEDRLI